MSSTRRARIIIFSLVIAGIAFTLGQTWPTLFNRSAYAVDPVDPTDATAARDRLSSKHDVPDGFQDVAKAIAPSVVNISSFQRIQSHHWPSGSPEDLLRRFFGDQLPPGQGGGGENPVRMGIGSGVIVSKDGYIITNNHVVKGATTLTVTLADDRQLDAEVIGTDAQTDLAVLRIKANDLLPAEFGDSDAIEVGQWVVASGSPFGLRRTLTAGIISAKGRTHVMGNPQMYEDFIQTDAAINPGNSGGPLVDTDGKVIGINSAIATSSGGYEGIGFAIPSNMAQFVMKTIIEHGEVVRGWLGVSIQNLTEALAGSFDFKGTKGVLIADVVPNGPAAHAGLEAGDIIVSFDGKPVSNMTDLRNQVAETQPGKKADVKIFRNGQQKTVEVEIGKLAGEATSTEESTTPDELGITVQDLTPELARQLSLQSDQQGALVTGVQPGSIADRSGLLPGDVIVSVAGQHIQSASEFRHAIRNSDLSKGVRLRVLTNGSRRFVFLHK